jgi:hypothetical protein
MGGLRHDLTAETVDLWQQAALTADDPIPAREERTGGSGQALGAQAQNSIIRHEYSGQEKRQCNRSAGEKEKASQAGL